MTRRVLSGALYASLLLAATLLPFSAHAQKVLSFGGGLSHGTNAESTYGWELGYSQGLNDRAYLSLGWLNEGHQENDHRDGITAQFWLHADYLQQRLLLAAGVGPYLFFDTTRDEAHPFYAPYTNDHGLGLIFSGELAWRWSRHWLIYLRANQIQSHKPHATTMLLLGVGYQFGSAGTGAPQVPEAYPETIVQTDNELALFLGHAVLNSFAPEQSTAFAVEYRHALSRHLEWTLGWLKQGGNRIIHRNGITTQFWLVRPLLHSRLTLGIGAGAYLMVNQQNNVFAVNNGQVSRADGDDERVAGMVSLTASCQFTPHWFARLSFNRLVTHRDRDADVLLLGGGLRF